MLAVTPCVLATESGLADLAGAATALDTAIAELVWLPSEDETQPVEVLRELAARLPEVRLWKLYGQTEIAPVATMLGPDDPLRKAGSASRPVLTLEMRVIDDLIRDMPTGEVGEIVHRSPQLMPGYYRDEDRTAAAFEGG